MSKMPYISILKELEPFRKQITSTVKPYVKITAKKNTTNIHQSKFAGNPYLPKSVEHPKDKNGKPMKLLAQLNFEEIPKLGYLPEKGILQFFIAAEDDVMGINFDDMTDQSNFRILYHSEIISDNELLVTDFSYMNKLDTEYFPIQYELSLSFNIEHEPVSAEDYRINELLGDSVDLSQKVKTDLDQELWELYSDSFLGDGHKMGGYPFFTQSDPRDYEPRLLEHEILLLQIDTDDEIGIMWGDGGIANFFIRKEDLNRLNFSNVIYNWDCH
jgi:uncharacterized protein YwqG